MPKGLVVLRATTLAFVLPVRTVVEFVLPVREFVFPVRTVVEFVFPVRTVVKGVGEAVVLAFEVLRLFDVSTVFDVSERTEQNKNKRVHSGVKNKHRDAFNSEIACILK